MNPGDAYLIHLLDQMKAAARDLELAALHELERLDRMIEEEQD